jgi:transcriptional regulator with XRE-family HTH domain
MNDVKETVAGNVRRLRKARGLSMNEVARQSTVAKATLVQLESGRGNPTMETLMALATVLGVRLADLIAEGSSPVIHVTRADEGSVLEQGVMKLRLLHRMTTGETMSEVFEMTVRAGAHRSRPHGAGVLEQVFLSSGALIVGPEREKVVLGPGDFIAYPADHPHIYESTAPVSHGTLTVVYPVAVSPPPSGGEPGESPTTAGS